MLEDVAASASGVCGVCSIVVSTSVVSVSGAGTGGRVDGGGGLARVCREKGIIKYSACILVT